MLELLLLLGGSSQIYVPDSGPGSQYIIAGDQQLGYFGRVSSSELFTASQLSDAVGLSNLGLIQEEYAEWLKFSYNQRILFIPKQPLRNSISYQDLYQHGLVYGTDDDGVSVTPAGSPVNQATVAAKNTWKFKVRLIKGSTGVIPMAAGGEWNDLIYRVNENNPSGLPNFEYFTNLEMLISGGSSGYWTWMMERDASFPYVRGYNSLAGLVNSGFANKDSRYGWRPVLELVLPGDPMVKPGGVSYLFEDTTPLPVAGIGSTFTDFAGSLSAPSEVHSANNLVSASALVAAPTLSPLETVHYTGDGVTPTAGVSIQYL